MKRFGYILAAALSAAPGIAIAQWSGGASTALPAGLALLNANQSFTKGQAVTPVSGGSVLGTVTPNASLGNDFIYTLIGNITLANPTNLKAGQTLNFDFTQDATGSRTLTLGSEYVPAGGGSITLSTAPNAEDFMSCRSITTSKLLCVLASSGSGGGGGGSGGNMTGSGATTSGNLLQSNNTGTPLSTATDSGIAASTVVTLTGTQTLTNKTVSGASNTLSNIGNGSLTNSSVTIGSTAVSLGGTAGTVAGLTLTTPTINGAALSGTLSGSPTLSGAPVFSGLTTGTQVSCLGLTSANVLALSTGACASSGTTTITAGPGLGSSQTSFNGTGAAQTVTNGSTLYPQLGSVAKTAAYTLNADCSVGVLCDTARLVLANGTASIALTAPNPAGTLAPYQIADEAGHGFTVPTVGGTATFSGCVSGSPTTLTVPANYSVQLFDQGVGNGYFCVLQFLGSTLPVANGGTGVTAAQGTGTKVQLATGSFNNGDGLMYDANGNAVDSGITAGLTHYSMTYVSGQVPKTGWVMASQIPFQSVIKIIGTVGSTAAGSGTTIDVYAAPSGTACGSGTKLTTTSFAGNGTINTDQTLAGSGGTIAAGDRLCWVVGGTWTSNTGDGSITVYGQP